MKLIVAVTGASGVSLALKFIKYIPKDIKLFVVFSNSAKLSLKLESNIALPNSENIIYYDNKSIDASISSGSFGVDAMIVIPCSANSLAKFAVGIADNLISRVFAVSLKENRKIVIVPREMPYSLLFLKNMTKLSKMGVVVAPPVLAYYSGQKTIEDMERFMIGRWMDMLNIKNSLYKRWSDEKSDI
ncbi:MAG: 3-octaprenyl-4-hydroxybenzoate carboxy-lyase [Campylobacteraceae bacterium 4484_166]|nr:MAG: 3-octaprenyl-4-hydroxybenzoate carboxy-lyase [Campylobacteraceae bacterium 4484_166]